MLEPGGGPGAQRPAAADGYGRYAAELSRRGFSPTMTRVAGTGVAGALGDTGPASAAQLNTPQSVAVDACGTGYIADVGNNRDRMVDPHGIITTVAGSGVPGFSGDGGDALAARLNGPRGVALDPCGRLHVTDSANGRIRRLDPAVRCCR